MYFWEWKFPKFAWQQVMSEAPLVPTVTGGFSAAVTGFPLVREWPIDLCSKPLHMQATVLPPSNTFIHFQMIDSFFPPSFLTGFVRGKLTVVKKKMKKVIIIFPPRNYLEDILAGDKGMPLKFCARRDLSDWFIGTWKAELAGRIWWRNGHTIRAVSKMSEIKSFAIGLLKHPLWTNY